jgi:hypothetical protein
MSLCNSLGLKVYRMKVAAEPDALSLVLTMKYAAKYATLSVVVPATLKAAIALGA